MNSATVKYNKIVSKKGYFEGSVHTFHKDIVALLAMQPKKSFKRKIKGKYGEPSNKRTTREPLPFVKHSKDSTSKAYKVGDTKEQDGNMFYYCNSPTHRDCIKWHTYSHGNYCVRKAWLQKTSKDGADTPAQANTGEVDADQINSIPTDATSALTSEDVCQQSLKTLLATAMNLVTDNDVLRNHIAEAINTASSIEWPLSPVFKIALLLFHSRLLRIFFPTFNTLILLVFHTYIVYNIMTQHYNTHRTSFKYTYKRKWHGRPTAPFSVSITDAINDTTLMVLSSIQTASSWYLPIVQCLIKTICFTRHNNHIKNQCGYSNHRGLVLLMFLLLFFSCAPSIHAIPGTNHVIIEGQASSDIHR